MRKLFFSALALVVAALPFSSMAENIDIYGWQNYSWELVSVDKDMGSDRDFDSINANDANIGFISHMETGIPGLQVGFRCEQFTFHNRLTSSGWCNRNSKISLRHETMGEIMFGQWLLPYNEIVAQWVDPFYDVGADSHTSIMGNIGFGGTFYNGGTFPLGGGVDFDYSGVYSLSFNRRQEEIVQYVWPNTDAMADQSRDGFQFRFAITAGFNDDSDIGPDNAYNVDPRIWSTGVSWQHNMMNGGQIWLAAAYERHDDWTAFELNRQPLASVGGVLYASPAGLADYSGISCSDSEDDGWRLAAHYNHNWGNGMNTMIAAMWEELDYEADDCILNEGGNPVDIIWDDVERESWMYSAKHNFGNGWAVKFSYMGADDLDCPGGECIVGILDDGETDADAWNVGLTYTMPAGTELRLTYSDVNNSDQSNYDFGINGAGTGLGEDVDMWAIGIAHWFD